MRTVQIHKVRVILSVASGLSRGCLEAVRRLGFCALAYQRCSRGQWHGMLTSSRCDKAFPIDSTSTVLLHEFYSFFEKQPHLVA